MKRPQKIALIILIGAAVLCLIASYLSLGARGQWIESAGLLFDIAGVVQLEISGLFDAILQKYGDDEKYPYGPPSYITREIIDDPERPIRSWLRNKMFFEHKFGFWLIVFGFVFQLAGTWLS